MKIILTKEDDYWQDAYNLDEINY